jgi:hypothetical protein
MNLLTIKFENCYGIGEMDHVFDFTQSNTNIVYAPNGTMKTSFAKTFDAVAKNDPKNLPQDRIYSSRETKCEIQVDSDSINPDNILVINAEDSRFDASNKISTFLASKELKEKYDTIYLDLNSRKSEFVKKLKNISQSTDCESELMATFATSVKDSFFDVLLNNVESLKEHIEKYQFRYNDVFDKKGNVKKFLEKNENILTQYINNYKDLLSKSNFFKESEKNSFGTYQANEIIKSIEDNSFFDAGHKFVLEDGTEIATSEQLRVLVQTEIDKILNDTKLKTSFEKVDKAIGANIELRSFQRVIEKDNLILIHLKDYDNFKKLVWINYLSELQSDAIQLVDYYKSQMNELGQIIKEARKEFSLWTKIIKTFNERFFVPFKVVLINQDDIILKQETASLEFDYADKTDAPIRHKIDTLIGLLSKGEQRAYFILQFLFEIESRKTRADKTLLIFDDIADSFDYKNKFAIIEYIRELSRIDTFRSIILTHNFDFYRTIASRLSLPRKVVYMATKSETKQIFLFEGQYRKDVFAYFIKKFAERKIFISLIAFVRNLLEYSEGDDCPEYQLLTNCLHKKASSDTLLVKDIFSIFQSRLPKLSGKTISFGNENLFEFIFATADSICIEANVNEILLENKISLAVAIRLSTENYLISKLPEIDLSLISSNQTQVLLRHYQEKYELSDHLSVLDRVNLMTPENIHINAFMYEPLIDMSVNHLIDLYQKTRSLTTA